MPKSGDNSFGTSNAAGLTACSHCSTAHRGVSIHHMEVLANRWTVRDLIAEAQVAAERRAEKTKPISVVGCLVGYP